MAKDDVVKYQFQPGQSGNPKGRPKNRAKAQCEKVLGRAVAKNCYGMTNEELDYWDALLMTADMDVLKKIAQDAATPMYAKTYAIAILSDMKNGSTRTMDKLREFRHGKAAGKLELVGADGQPLIPVDAILGTMTNEELMKAREEARKEENRQ